MQPETSRQQANRALLEHAGILVLVATLVYACLKVAEPFIGPFIWAVILALSTWPFYLRLSDWLNGRRTLTAVLLAGAILLLFALPFSLAISAAIDAVPALPEISSDLAQLRQSDPPDWVADLPLIGSKIDRTWREKTWSTLIDPAKVRPVLTQVAGWLLQQGATLATGTLHLVMATVIAGLLFVHGENAAHITERFALRLSGDSGVNAVRVAARTVQGVFLGVIGTALLQGTLAGIGFAAAGVPGAALLGLTAVVFALLQIGTSPIGIPVALWLFHVDQNFWAVATIIWTVFINTIDNFIKPYVISRTSGQLPILLIFVGVIGGFLAWGFTGIFIGSTLMAVAYTVFTEWLGPESESSQA